MKTLTVVVSCYNCSKTIKAALESIPATGNDDFEVMIIDDGSTENILPIIQPFLDKYPNTMKYIRKDNGGHGSCVNYSIEHANSRYVAYLDSDDTYNPLDFNIALSALKRTHENIDLVLLNYNMVFVNKNCQVVKRCNSISKTNKWIEYTDFDHMDLGHVMTLHNSIYSLDLLKKIHKMPEKVCYEDNVLYYEVFLRVKNVAYLNKVIHLYNYFIYGDGQQSISINRIVKNLNDMLIVYKYALSLPLDEIPKARDKIVRQKFNHIIGFILVGLSNDNTKNKKEKAVLAKWIYAMYRKFIDANKTRKIKPIIWRVFSRLKYGGTILMKFLTQVVHFSFLQAVMHQPKVIKTKNK